MGTQKNGATISFPDGLENTPLNQLNLLPATKKTQCLYVVLDIS